MPDIYLYQGEVNPADVLLSDPTVLRAGSTASISAAQTLASLTQSASVATVIAATASQTLADVSQATNVATIVAVATTQTLGGIGQAVLWRGGEKRTAFNAQDIADFHGVSSWHRD